jgi:RNA polymerase sigma-70 factor (ECF subfamily)
MQTLKQAAIFDGQSSRPFMEVSQHIVTIEAFEEVFKSQFKALHAYACTILRDEVVAEDIVQQVFFKLWEKKDQLVINQSIAAYLYRAVYNDCLNHIKHQKVKQAHQAHTLHTSREGVDPVAGNIRGRELEQKIAEALNQLPEQCRTIFQLSRFEELKYREIAERLNLSVKTVENQMGKALKIMRIQLAEFLPTLMASLLWMMIDGLV